MKKTIFLIMLILATGILFAETADDWNIKGDNALDNENYSEAIKYYTNAIKTNPDYLESYYSRGYAYYMQENYSLAIKDYSSLLYLDSEDSGAYYNRGLAYSKLKKYDLAIKDYSNAIKINPEDQFSYYNRGYIYGIDLLQYDLALKDFNKAIELDPTFSAAQNYIGCMYYQKQDYNRALEELSKAVKIDSKIPFPYANRGDIYLLKNSFKKAIKDYKKALSLDFKNHYYHVLKYIAIKRSGTEDKGELKNYFSSLPSEEWPIPIIAMFIDEISIEECLKFAANKNSQKENEQLCEAYYYIGQYYLIQGNKDLAKQYFKKCVETEVRHFIEYRGAKAELERM